MANWLMSNAAVGAAVFGLSLVFAAPEADAQSRRELERRINALDAQVAEMSQRLGQVSVSGDPTAVRLFERLDALEIQVANLNGTLERLSRDNAVLKADLRTLVRELQLRDREIATASGMSSEFAGLSSLDSLFADTPTAAPVEQYVGIGAPYTPGSGASASNGVAASAGPTRLTPGGQANAGGVVADPIPAGPAPFEGAPLTAPASAGPTVSTPPQLATANPRVNLEQAKDLLISGQYTDAERVLRSVLAQSTNDPALAAEAHYFIGETFFVAASYVDAAESYISSLEADQFGPRGADAMVRLASSLTAIGQPAEACLQLDDFDRQYPGASPETRDRAERARVAASCY